MILGVPLAPFLLTAAFLIGLAAVVEFLRAANAARKAAALTAGSAPGWICRFKMGGTTASSVAQAFRPESAAARR